MNPSSVSLRKASEETLLVKEADSNLTRLAEEIYDIRKDSKKSILNP